MPTSPYGEIPERTTEQLIAEVKADLKGGKDFKQILKDKKYLVYFFRTNKNFENFLTKEAAKYKKTPQHKAMMKKFQEPITPATGVEKPRRTVGVASDDDPYQMIVEGQSDQKHQDKKLANRNIIVKLLNKMIGDPAAILKEEDDEKKTAE